MAKRKLPSEIHDVDLRRLRVFRAVAERGGFTAAEADLNIGRSTISIHISDLEQRLGMVLCERKGKAFRLTESGEIVYEASIQLVEALERFREQVYAAKDVLGGELRIGCMDQLSSHPDFRLNDALRRFRTMAPKVQIALQVAPLDQIERDVVSGDLDIGIMVCFRELAGLEYQDFIEEDQGLYCGVGHPLFDKLESDIDWARVEKYDRVGQRYAESDEELRERLHSRPAAIAHSAEALAHLILTGYYVGVLPVHYANQWVRQGNMRALLQNEFNSRRKLKIVRKKGAGSGQAIQAFTEHLLKASRL